MRFNNFSFFGKRAALYLNFLGEKEPEGNNLKREILDIYSGLSFPIKLYVRLRLMLFNRLWELENWIPDFCKILDLGCGYGIFTNILALKYKAREITGIDYLEKRIEAAEKSQGKYGGKIKYIVGDINNLKFEEYNVITIVDVLYYLPFRNQDKLLKTCYDNLSEGGLLLIKDFNRYPLWKYFLFYLQEIFVIYLKICFANKLWRDIFKGRLYVRNYTDMEVLLKKLGFVVKSTAFGKGRYQSHFLYICHKEKSDLIRA